MSKLPTTIQVGAHQARVFKLVSISTCKQCGNEGHRPSDPACPARSTEDIQQSVETFCGGRCELSNLHQCLEGCEIEDFGTEFPTCEHHYQFKKLKAHDLGAEAYELLIQEDSFQAIKKAKTILPDADVSEDWKCVACDEMLATTRLKYEFCLHACEYLLKSKITIAEATGDPFWGTGLGVQQTLDCLPDFWPSTNHMGQILLNV